MKGQIVKLTGGLYTVLVEETLWRCKPRGVFRKTGESPCVGDLVVLEPIDHLTATITEILPRKNILVRPPVANLDQLVLVVSTRDPRPNYLTLDKLLAVLESHEIPTLLAVTKADLADGDKLAEEYRAVGYPVVVINPETGEGVADLLELLEGSFCAFVGNSGVGKSTLLNRIAPELALETGETSKKLGRGRHTTRHSEVFSLQNGIRIADTPGFSSLDLLQTTNITAEELGHCFREFRPVISHCKFRDCRHMGESGCAVREAVQSSEILERRYQNYCQLFDEIKDVKEWQRK